MGRVRHGGETGDRLPLGVASVERCVVSVVEVHVGNVDSVSVEKAPSSHLEHAISKHFGLKMQWMLEFFAARFPGSRLMVWQIFSIEV